MSKASFIWLACVLVGRLVDWLVSWSRKMVCISPPRITIYKLLYDTNSFPKKDKGTFLTYKSQVLMWAVLVTRMIVSGLHTSPWGIGFEEVGWRRYPKQLLNRKSLPPALLMVSLSTSLSLWTLHTLSNTLRLELHEFLSVSVLGPGSREITARMRYKGD